MCELLNSTIIICVGGWGEVLHCELDTRHWEHCVPAIILKHCTSHNWSTHHHEPAHELIVLLLQPCHNLQLALWDALQQSSGGVTILIEIIHSVDDLNDWMTLGLQLGLCYPTLERSSQLQQQDSQAGCPFMECVVVHHCAVCFSIPLLQEHNALSV